MREQRVVKKGEPSFSGMMMMKKKRSEDIRSPISISSAPNLITGVLRPATMRRRGIEAKAGGINKKSSCVPTPSAYTPCALHFQEEEPGRGNTIMFRFSVATAN